MSSNYSVASTTAATSSSSSTVYYPKKIFLNVSPSTTETRLYFVMQQYGPVNRVHIPMDRETGKSRGFAFVTFRWHEDAVAAIRGLEGVALDGLILRDLRWAAPKKNKDARAPKPKRNGSRKKKNHSQQKSGR